MPNVFTERRDPFKVRMNKLKRAEKKAKKEANYRQHGLNGPRAVARRKARATP